MAEETIVVIVDEAGEHEFVINANLMNQQLTDNCGEIVLQLDDGQNLQFDGNTFLNGNSIYEIKDDMLAIKTLGEEFIEEEEDETLKGRRISTLLSGPKKYLPTVDDIDFKDFDLTQTAQQLILKADPIEDQQLILKPEPIHEFSLVVNQDEQAEADAELDPSLTISEFDCQPIIECSDKKRISTLPFDENYVFKKEPPKSSRKLFSDSFSEFLSNNSKSSNNFDAKSTGFKDLKISAITTADDIDNDDDSAKFNSQLNSGGSTCNVSEEAATHKCGFCDKSFKAALSLDLHQMSSHSHDPTLPLHCELCGKSFKQVISLELHKLSHSEPFTGVSKKEYQCPVESCTFHCPMKITIKKHVTEQHSCHFIHVCTRCKFTGLTSRDYTEHLKSEQHRKVVAKWTQKNQNVSKPFMCSHCGRQFSSKRSLSTHKMVHQQSEFPCDMCSYVGSTSYYLNKHKLTHRKDQKYSCSSCSYETYNPDGLKRHIKNMHVVGKVRYSCRMCPATFSLRSELRVHSMMEHGSSDTHFCSHCSFSCKGKDEYKEHLQIHFGNARFQCELCDYKCNIAHQLRRHMMRHSDQKQFKCHICSSAFYEKTDLKRHMFNHSDSKPFKCSLCNYTCKFQNTLTLHMKTHSDVKGYACTQCNYTTKYLQNLRKHEIIHDLRNGTKHVEMYSCDYCDYETPFKENVKKHTLRMHDVIL